MHRKLHLLFSCFFLLLFAVSCNQEHYPDQPPSPRPAVIDLSEVKVELPEARGKELVQYSCVTCHSLRYIEMQPHLSEKAWEKTVNKMIHSFGAQMKDSSSAKQIIHYLAGIRG